jgi:hypothetical protein
MMAKEIYAGAWIKGTEGDAGLTRVGRELFQKEMNQILLKNTQKRIWETPRIESVDRVLDSWFPWDVRVALKISRRLGKAIAKLHGIKILESEAA